MTDLATFISGMSGTSARAHDGTSWLFGWALDGLRVGMRVSEPRTATPALIEVTFAPAPGEPLTPTRIHAAPVGALFAEAREEVVRVRREVGEYVSPSPARLDPFLTPRRGVPLRDEDFAQLALEYVLLVDDGDRSPARTLSTKYGNGSPGQWSNRIGEARRRGLLTEGRRGVSEGRLTEHAERLLGHDS